MADERRAGPRAGFSGTTILRGETGEWPCVGADLSEGGMLLQPLLPSAPPAEPVRVSFVLPDAALLTLHAAVVRHGTLNDKPAWGIKFRRTPPDVRRMLRTYVFTGKGQVREYRPN